MSFIIKAGRILELAAFFLKEVVKANLQVAWMIFQPPEKIHPSFLKIPLDVQSETGIYLLSSMITLTPGTLSLEVSADRKYLYVHAMHAPDPAAVVRDIKSGFEQRLLGVGC